MHEFNQNSATRFIPCNFTFHTELQCGPAQDRRADTDLLRARSILGTWIARSDPVHENHTYAYRVGGRSKFQRASGSSEGLPHARCIAGTALRVAAQSHRHRPSFIEAHVAESGSPGGGRCATFA